MELRLVDHAGFLRRKALVPIDVLDQLGTAEVPKLELLVGLMRTGQEIAIMKINGVTANEWLENGAYWTRRCADIPNTHGLVPAAGDDKIGII